MRLRLVFLAAAALGAAVAPSAAGGVLVVDATAPPAFTTIQAAVNAAADGDVILVKSGTYGPVKIIQKGVKIVADTGATVQINGGILIQDTFPLQPVVLRGLNSTGAKNLAQGVHEGLRLSDVHGPVRAEECVFQGGKGNDYSPIPTVGGDGVFAENCPDVTFANCEMLGGKGGDTFRGGVQALPGDGLEFAAGSVALYASLVQGAPAALAEETAVGTAGGQGLFAHTYQAFPGLATTVFAAGSTFIGADGGADPACLQAGNGGDGALLVGQFVSATFLDCRFQWGMKGACGSVVPGKDGVAVELQVGATAQLDADIARLLSASAPVRAGQSVAVDISGVAGDQAFVLVSAVPTWSPAPEFDGVFHVGLPVAIPAVVPLGVLPGGGALHFGAPIPPLPPGVLDAVIHAQIAVIDAQGATRLGGITALVVLDPSF